MQVFIKKHVKSSGAAPGSREYPAFISYSHRDEHWARWLHKAIEAYRVPKPLVGRQGPKGPVPRQIFPVFRDRDEFASSADLPSVLREALGRSAHLIVLCSPAAARSRWVNEEIVEFKRLGRGDRILPLVVDGEPHAALPERECFPAALRFQVDAEGRLTDQPAEPIAADLRPEADGEENAKLKLIAGVLGVSFNELRQRELIAARRRARVWQGITAAMIVLTTLAAVGGVLAWRYGQHAEGLLADAIGISARQLGGTVRVADQQGVSRTMIEQLLGQAKTAFDGLYRRTAEAPRLPWRQAAVPARLRGEHAVLLLVLADQYGKVGNIAQQRQMAEQARSELTVVVEEEPSNLDWRRYLALSHDLIAGALAAEWQVEGALRSYTDALKIHEELAAADPDDLRWLRAIALSHTHIGDMLYRQGSRVPALDAYGAALAIERHLAASAPPTPQLLRDLLMGNQRVGDMLLEQGEYEAAEATYREALASAEPLADAAPTNVQAQRDLSITLAKLGAALRKQGKREAALKVIVQSREITEDLGAKDTDDVRLQRDLFKIYESLGMIFFEEGNQDAAEFNFRSALKIAEPLATKYPNNRLLQRDVSVLHVVLGDVFEAQYQLNDAVREYGTALEAHKELAKIDPTNAQAQQDLLLSYERVGEAHYQMKHWPRALDNYNALLDFVQRLADDDPPNRQSQLEVAIAHHNVAIVLDAADQSEAAIEAYEAALRIAEALARAAPSEIGVQTEILTLYWDLGQLQESKGNHADTQRRYCAGRAIVQHLINLEPQDDKWQKYRTAIEQKLRTTPDAEPASC